MSVHRFRLTTLALAAITAACTPPVNDAEPMWWRGNLHTHTLWSDGDQYPEVVIDWYRTNGYDFVALSDHNVLQNQERWIDVDSSAGGQEAFEIYRTRFAGRGLQQRVENGRTKARLRTFEESRALFDRPGEFLVVQGEEITDGFETKPVHVNATNVREYVEPQGGASVFDVLQNNINAVVAQRERTGQPMFPHVNHPNFGWAVTAEDLMSLENERFFEVYNGHPLVHNDDDPDRPSTDRMWDIVLAERLRSGREVMYGIGVDDAHAYGEMRTGLANPGRGWVMVEADTLTIGSIIAAMEAGRFYATSGVILGNVSVTNGELRIDLRPEPSIEYVTQFIGTRVGYDTTTTAAEAVMGSPTVRVYSDEIGEVLAESRDPSPRYRFRGDELYVRAKIVSSKRKTNPYREGEFEAAWTQPVIRQPRN